MMHNVCYISLIRRKSDYCWFSPPNLNILALARKLVAGLTGAAICHSFATALSPADIDQSGFDPGETPAFGVFARDSLCAMASYQIWEPRIAHITVATHPKFRCQGYGRKAVSALAEHAFARKLILQYRALATNENSLKLGDSLGFDHYCSTIYARLQPS